jgi:GNAT superfamily N-acetyltransferase
MRSIVWECLRGEARLFGQSAPSSRLFEREGLLASVVPATPDRSMFNWVVARNGDALARSYDELARLYRESGVRAFTVWVDPDDGARKDFLAARGHVLDASPRGMAADLSTMTLADLEGLDCRETRDVAMVGRLNDLAYGFPGPAFSAALVSIPFAENEWRAFEARVGGEPVGCGLTWDGPHGDVGVSCIATVSSARGHRIASRLLSYALSTARDRGMRTTSLQATSKGKGVYARLGYEDIGAIEMWEHRVPLAHE